MTDRLALHPFLFAVAPILVLYARNLFEVEAREIIRPLLLALTLALAVQLGVSLVLENPDARAAASSVVIVAFFAYGGARRAAASVFIGGLELARHRYFLPLWVVAVAAGFAGAAWIGSRAGWLTVALTALAGAEVAIAAAVVVEHSIRSRRAASPSRASRVTARPAEAGARDIYYLVFDRYSGREVLDRMYGFDNSPFLGRLESCGFWVPEKTFANYRSSKFSLASSLNMRYIHSPDVPSVTEPQVRSLIRNNELGVALRNMGYRFVNVGSWWAVDKHISVADVNLSSGSTEFVSVLFEKTVLSGLGGVVGRRDSRSTHARAARFQLDKLCEMAASGAAGPTFVYAHVLLPHLPYVFDGQGREISEKEAVRLGETRAYLEQLQFANSQILQLVELLQERPVDEHPIVVIQADEGQHPRDARPPDDPANDPEARLRNRFDILNALYLPAKSVSDSTAPRSPVNTFRYILREYFAAELPPVDDRCFDYERKRGRYEFFEVTERLVPRS